LAKRLDANYSRYADDLIFSGDRTITSNLLRHVPQIVKDEGFALNTSKTRVLPQTTRQTVTGIVVNNHLNIDRKTFDHLKAVIHACQKEGDNRLSDPAFRASLEGKIAWVETINPSRGQKLWRLLDNVKQPP
jgi:retron-type reverse transcriptase